MTRDDLEALRAKYDEMLRLRLEHDSRTPESPEGADPRTIQRAMSALASRFPGALREIDDLPLDAIRTRIDDLRAAVETGRAAPWMEATHLFHSLTRGALCAKRWLADRKLRDPGAIAAAGAAFAVEASALCWGDDALAWRDDLVRLATPPRGRVTDLVYERMAGLLGTTEDGARTLVFGKSRRERQAGAEG